MEACHDHDKHRAGTDADCRSHELRVARPAPWPRDRTSHFRSAASQTQSPPRVQPTRLLCQGLGARGSPVCALSRWTRTSRLAGGARPPHPPQNSEVWRRGSESCELERHAHADRYGHGCPSAPAMQHSSGAVTAALQLATNSSVASTRAAAEPPQAALLVSDSLGNAWSSARRRRRRPASSATARRLERQCRCRRGRDRFGACSFPTFG